MTREIEQNDVDIHELFKWRKEVTIEDEITNQSVTLYLRLVGDSNVGKARAYALRKSGELRKSLRDTDSNERASLITSINELSHEDKKSFIQILLFLKIEEHQTQSMKNVDLASPTPPGTDASLEEQEEYQQEIDEFPSKFTDAMSEKTTELQEEEEKRLKTLSEKQLQKEYESLIINRLCVEEMAIRFYEMVVYNGTFKTSKYKKLAFKSFADFQDVAPTLKERLIVDYKNLEMGIGALKKLPEATESESRGH